MYVHLNKCTKKENEIPNIDCISSELCNKLIDESKVHSYF